MNIDTMSSEDAKYIFNFLRSGNYWSDRFPHALEERVGEQDAQTLMLIRLPSITFKWAKLHSKWILAPQNTGGNTLTEAEWYQIVSEVGKFYTSIKRKRGHQIVKKVSEFYTSVKRKRGRPPKIPTKAVIIIQGIEETANGWNAVCPKCGWTGKSPYKTEKRAKQALGGHKSFCPTLNRLVNTLATGIDVGPLTHENRSKSGYVYLMGGGNYFKIGLSINPDIRLEQIEPKMPYDIELIHTIPTNSMYNAEKYLHRKFASKRVKGEWFELSQDDIVWIKNCKELMYA